MRVDPGKWDPEGLTQYRGYKSWPALYLRECDSSIARASQFQENLSIQISMWDLPVSTCRQLVQRKVKTKSEKFCRAKSKTKNISVAAGLRPVLLSILWCPSALFLELPDHKHCFGAVCIYGRIGLWFNIYLAFLVNIFHTLLKCRCAY